MEFDLSRCAYEEVIIAFEADFSVSEGWYADNIVIIAPSVHHDVIIYSKDFEGYSVGTNWGDWTIVEKLGLTRISKPKLGTLYIFDRVEITAGIPDSMVYIIEPITITTFITPEGEPYPFDGYFEFYIDNELKAARSLDNSSYLWDEFSFGKRTIKVTAYGDLNGDGDIDITLGNNEIDVWKFF
jgi:hypothetical protein